MYVCVYMSVEARRVQQKEGDSVRCGKQEKRGTAAGARTQTTNIQCVTPHLSCRMKSPDAIMNISTYMREYGIDMNISTYMREYGIHMHWA